MMNKKFLVFMFLFIGFFVIANVSAWSEDEFNNSLTTENITFSGSENLTRWLTVPENTIVTNAFMNLSGYDNFDSLCYQESVNISNETGIDGFCDLNYSGVYQATCNNIGNAPCPSAAYDGNWSTFNNGIDNFYMNYTKPSLAIGANWSIGTGDISLVITNFTIPSSCFDYFPNQINLHLASYSLAFEQRVFVYCYNGSYVKFGETVPNTGSVINEEAIYWNISEFTNNPNIQINNTQIWSQTGNLTSTNSPQKTSNFASTINSYIASATAIAGNYLIPFIFHSDTAGILEYLALVFSSDGYLTQSTTYDATITEGQASTVLESILVSPENSLTSAVFQYNNTNYTTNIIFSGNEYNISSTITTPLVSTDTNISFSFFLVIDGVTYETTSYNHTVTDVAFSNCTAGDALATFLLVDEELQTALFGDIEISAYITNPTTSAVVSSINLTYTNVSNASICLTPNSSFNDYKLFYEVRYTADDYVSEFYNVKNANMSAYPKYIALYDLASNDSTEFIVEYRNDNYVTIEDAVVLLLRQYLAEDSYKVVEAPTTSSTGTSILHVDLNTNKYRVIVLKDGVILNTFTNIVFHCENELSGQCTQELYGGVDPQNTVTLESLDDFSYSVTKVNETLTLTYSVPSGSASVNLYLYQIDLFGNTYLCNETVYSSGGSIDCSYNNTIGDSMVYLEVRKDGELMASKSYFVEENTDLGFLGNNFFIVFIFIVTITGMALSSPEWMVIMSVITLLLTGSLWLLNGLTFAIGFGSLMWLIVAAGIIIFKLSRQEDR